MSPDDRQRLAEQQAALAAALAGSGETPVGFNEDHVARAAASLLAKRRRGVEKTWPGLAESLGDQFRSVFETYARAHSLPAEGAGADGRQFARHLRRLGQLSDDGRLQLLLADLGRRRPLGVAYLPAQRRFVIAFRIRREARWFTFPSFRRRARDADTAAAAP